MLFKLLLMSCCLALSATGFSQTDSTKMKQVFDRISNSMKSYKIDTSAVPDDKITRQIIELRNLRGGFNIEEALAYKMEEEKQKKEQPADKIESISNYLTEGAGKQKLNNAVIWIYRNMFTYSELKQLTKFYKTTAGQKMAEQFPVIMLQCAAAADIIKEEFINKNK